MDELPKSIPLLKPRQFCRHSLDGPGRTHCLVGWRVKLFGGTFAYRVATALEDEVYSRRPNWGVSNFNDDSRNSRRTLASVWRRAMERLGYVVRGNRLVLPKAKVPR